jgi:KipI family sensor histidine kinase inhibitor
VRAEIVPSSDRSVLVRVGREISAEARECVRRLLWLLQAEPIAAVRNLNPAYCSVLVTFDPARTTHAEMERVLTGYLERLDSVTLAEPRLVEIPVWYGGEFGPDLEAVAAHCGLAPAEVIERHAARDYTVDFLGFAPGFAYLSGMDARLATPRLEVPRRRVPAGSVGIGGGQTGVYPFATPGGWRLIGRTSLKLFEAGREPMSLVGIGDRVRFVVAESESPCQ